MQGLPVYKRPHAHPQLLSLSHQVQARHTITNALSTGLFQVEAQWITLLATRMRLFMLKTTR